MSLYIPPLFSVDERLNLVLTQSCSVPSVSHALFWLAWISLSKSSGFLYLLWDVRLTHLVNYDCLLLIERVEKRINCTQQNAHQGNRSVVKHMQVISFCINAVSAVKYSEKMKSLHFWTSSWNRTEKNRGYLHFVEISILIHQSILACSLARVKFVARDDWHLTSDALIG